MSHTHELLVVYNICGLANKENIDWYIKCIDSILNQNNEDYQLVISSCMNTSNDIDRLRQEFGNDIFYNIINEILPVNATFNHAVLNCVKHFGKFNGYLYIDSGVHFDKKDILTIAQEKYDPNKFSMVTLPTENDMGFEGWFGFDFPEKDFIIPAGGACNLHAQIFSHDIYETFNERIWPDIFASYASESVFSFLNACVHKEWLVISDIKLLHDKGIDGASLGFHHGNFESFRSPRPILEIMRDPEAYKSGLGFAECPGLQILMHDKSLYDDNNLFVKDPQRLVNFINNNLFLSEESLDYNNIKHEFIK